MPRPPPGLDSPSPPRPVRPDLGGWWPPIGLEGCPDQPLDWAPRPPPGRCARFVEGDGSPWALKNAPTTPWAGPPSPPRQVYPVIGGVRRRAPPPPLQAPERNGRPRGRGQARKFPGGERNKHTGGHTAVAKGGGCAGPYPEAPLNALGRSRGAEGLAVCKVPQRRPTSSAQGRGANEMLVYGPVRPAAKGHQRASESRCRRLSTGRPGGREAQCPCMGFRPQLPALALQPSDTTCSQ